MLITKFIDLLIHLYFLKIVIMFFFSEQTLLVFGKDW